MFIQHKAQQPFISLLLPFIGGICMGLWVFPAFPVRWLICVIAPLFAVFLLLNLGYLRFKIYLNHQWLGGALASGILLLLGWLATIMHNETFSATHFSKLTAKELVVQISNEPQLSGRYIRFTTVVKQAADKQTVFQASGNLLVITPATERTKQFRYGDELLVKATYTATTPPYNPAEFNYKNYLSFQNIHYQLFANPAEVAVIRHDAGNTVIASALNLRKQLVEHLKAGIRDTNASAVASTLMLGYKADLSNEVLQAYSKTGTIHVLSVSGAHVAIIYVLITFFLNFLNRYRYGRLLNAVLSILLIWAYSLLTGFSPAVCRAALMITLFISGKTAYRQLSTLNILAASAFLLLVYDPYLLADVGFQLSYFAVFGLFVFHHIIYGQWEIENKWLKKLWYLCSASIAAQLITFPLSVYYFHQFPVYFLLSNLLIIIPTEVIMIAGGLFLICYRVPYVSALLACILEHTIIWMNTGLTYIEHLPYASAGQLWITFGELLLLTLVVIFIILFMHQRKAMQLIMALACVLLLALSTGFKKYTALNSSHITFLDLKKHSGIIFRNSRNAVVLTDVTLTDKVFAYSIQPCLDSMRVENPIAISFKQDVHNACFYKQDNYIQFLNSRMLILNDSLRYRPLTEPMKVDEIFITGSPHISLNLLIKSYIYDTVIADANNSKQAIARYETEAKHQHKKFICLKRNKSVTIPSN